MGWNELKIENNSKVFEDKINKDKNLSTQIQNTIKELKKFKIKPNYKENSSLEDNLKNLNNQLNQTNVKHIIQDRKSKRLNSSNSQQDRMPPSA